MAGPITWQNVTGPSMGDPSRMLLAAQNGFSGAFDSLSKALSDQQGANQFAQDQSYGAVTLAFKEALNNARTPEELAALQSSGKLTSLQAGMNNKGREATLGAFDARLASVNQLQVQAQDARDKAQAFEYRGPLNEMAMAFANGDTAKGESIRATLPVNLAGLGTTYQKGIDSAEARQTFKNGLAKTEADQNRQAAEDVYRAKMQPLELEAKRAGIDSAAEQLLVAREQRKVAAEQLLSSKTAAKAEAATQFLKESGNVYSDGVFNPNDSQPIMEMMVKNGIGDTNGERQAIIKRLSTLSEVDLPYIDGNNKNATKRVPVPMSMVKQAILGSKDQWVNGWDQGWANEVENNLKSSMKSLVPLKTADGRDYTQNKAVFDFDQYMQSRMTVAENPTAGGKPRGR